MPLIVPPQNPSRPVVYPDSDGMPMSDNTLQFEWIVTIKGGLDAALPDFVAGDLLWYPVEGHPEIRIGPDVLVALGRPKGYRGSYRQWEEGGVAPQVIFEILSPGNRWGEMARKLNFYQNYGVQEYYTYDPDRNELLVYHRADGGLKLLENPDGWVSPLLGIRFQTTGEKLQIFHRNDRPFLTFTELTERAERESRRADEATVRLAALEARLRALGLDPEG
ncbi:MAG TPA: Uma2 family endonuclease [Myxococcota bacterium]|nr:Uma2 family endonuclease [Myxococcota bacterium]